MTTKERTDRIVVAMLTIAFILGLVVGQNI